MGRVVPDWAKPPNPNHGTSTIPQTRCDRHWKPKPPQLTVKQPHAKAATHPQFATMNARRIRSKIPYRRHPCDRIAHNPPAQAATERNANLHVTQKQPRTPMSRAWVGNANGCQTQPWSTQRMATNMPIGQLQTPPCKHASLDVNIVTRLQSIAVKLQSHLWHHCIASLYRTNRHTTWWS